MKLPLRSVAPLVPYVAVLCGVYAFRSAWVAILLYHAAALAVICLSRECKPPPLGRASPWLPASFLIFAMAGAVFYWVLPLVAPEGLVSSRLGEFGLTKANWAVFAIYFCAANPVVEEVFWRDYLGSDGLRLHRNDILFGGYHGLVAAAFVRPAWILPIVAACALAGWLWRMLRLRTGGLAIPWLTHFAADASIAAAVYFRL